MAHPAFIARYEVLGLIGAGGMGAVYRARDPQIGGRLVAIKVLRRNEYQSDPLEAEQLKQRFTQEAHAAGRLENDHIVRIFDVGEHQGEPFIAMEYIDGDTLAALIKRRDPMPLAVKIDLMAQLCEGVEFAHQCGIVHRDIKPLNLVVNQRGRLKILDFGIAKMSDSSMHTMTGVFMGSCNYVSPEQVSGSSTLDYRSDIFSIGTVFYELLCYRQAFPGVPPAVLHKITTCAPDSLADAYAASGALAPDELPVLDPEIEGIVAVALQKDPDRRYQDIGQMLQDIETVRSRLWPSRAPGLRRPSSGVKPPAFGDRSSDITLPKERIRAVPVAEPPAAEAQRGKISTDKRPVLGVSAATPAPSTPPTARDDAFASARVLTGDGDEPWSPHRPDPRESMFTAVAPRPDAKRSAFVGLTMLVLIVGVVAALKGPDIVRSLFPRPSAPEAAPEAPTGPVAPIASSPDPAPLQLGTTPRPNPATKDVSAPARLNELAGTSDAAPQPSIAPSRPETPVSSSPPQPPQPVRIGGNIKPPTKLRDVSPVYPPIAQSARVQGVVIIEATIDVDGSVQEARVLRSIPLLDQAAVDAVLQWQFKPTLLNGVAVPVIMTVTVQFVLE